MESLTTSNLKKHTTDTHEALRTKINRYFNQAEDPEILCYRDSNPIQYSASDHDPWDSMKDLLHSSSIDAKLTVDAYQSQILGFKERSQLVNKMDDFMPITIQSAFQSEDNNILVTNMNKQNVSKGNVDSQNICAKRNRDDDGSDYSWSDSQQNNENAFVKRSRRKMILDPVTGRVNTNSKQVKPTKKKIARQNTFTDLRPLNQFNSKLIKKKQLTIDSSKSRWGVKDLEFPKLSDLGAQMKVKSGISKPMDRQRQLQDFVWDDKTQKCGDHLSDIVDKTTHMSEDIGKSKESISSVPYRGQNSAGYGFINPQDADEHIREMDAKANDDIVLENKVISQLEAVVEIDEAHPNGLDTRCPIQMKDASIQTVQDLSKIAEKSQVVNPPHSTTDQILSQSKDLISSCLFATSIPEMGTSHKCSQKSDELDIFESFTTLGPEVSNQPQTPMVNPLKRNLKSVAPNHEQICFSLQLPEKPVQPIDPTPFNENVANIQVQDPMKKDQEIYLQPIHPSDDIVERSRLSVKKNHIWRRDEPRDVYLNPSLEFNAIRRLSFPAISDISSLRLETSFETPVNQQACTAITSLDTFDERIAIHECKDSLPPKPTSQPSAVRRRGKFGLGISRPISQPLSTMNSEGYFRPETTIFTTMRDEIPSIEHGYPDDAVGLFSSSIYDDDNDGDDDDEYLGSEPASLDKETLDDEICELDITEPIVALPNEKKFWIHPVRKG